MQHACIACRKAADLRTRKVILLSRGNRIHAGCVMHLMVELLEVEIHRAKPSRKPVPPEIIESILRSTVSLTAPRG